MLNDTTVWVGQSGLSGGQTTPIFSQGIFGEGQTVGIIDTGIDPDMCFFRDTARGLPPTNAVQRRHRGGHRPAQGASPWTS